MKYLLLSLFVLVAGCGGSGGGSTVSPFIGSYSGTYYRPVDGNTGSVSMSVTGSGSLSGSVYDSIEDVNGSLSGKLNKAGLFKGSVKFPSLSSSFEGYVSLNGNHLIGTVTQTVQGQNYSVVFDLIKN